jgi:hypothetical protein
VPEITDPCDLSRHLKSERAKLKTEARTNPSPRVEKQFLAY